MTLRSIALKAHLYMAIVAGLPLAAVGVSGAALGAVDFLTGTTGIPHRFVEPAGEPRPLADLLSVASAAFPARPVAGVSLPRRPDVAYDIVMRDGRRVFVDPYRATVVDSMYLRGTFRRTAYDLHASLMAGETGKTVVGISTLVSVLLAISGLILWWPRGRLSQALLIKWRASWKRVNYDVHSVVGFYSSLVLLLLALSGAVIAYDGAAMALFRGADKNGMSFRSTPVPGGRTIPPWEALRIAEEALPGASPGWLGIPPNPRAVYAIFLKFPEEPGPGTSRVYIDQFSGRVLLVKSTREAHLGQRILDLNFPIHTGQVLGRPGQLLAVLVSAYLALQLFTGLFIWWQRRTPRRARASASEPAASRAR